MTAHRILVVEDDRTLLEVIKYNLAKEGYEVSVAAEGVTGLENARTVAPDLVILDIMLPGLDGLEVCRLLRKESNVPILMLTARTEEVDKVVGLELGADDYMTKPFSMRELVARVRAMLRRAEMMKVQGPRPRGDERSLIRVGDIEVDVAGHVVSREGVALDLSPKEFDLLVFLMRDAGHVFSRARLLEEVWGYDFEGDTRTVDVHIRWLRQKLETDPANPRHVLTVRGVGYKFER